MVSPQPWLICLIALIGNCGFWLFCFNQVNAAGLPRNWTKRLEKLLVLLCFSVPIVVAVVDRDPLVLWLNQATTWWPNHTTLFAVWAGWSLLSACVLGPPWLESRRWIAPPRQLISSTAQHFDVSSELSGPSVGNWSTYLLNQIPFNEITKLELNRKELLLDRHVLGVEGLTIGHLSDLHFTGQLTFDHFRFVLDRFQEMEPDLIVITGDIIDLHGCLPWIESLLGSLSAPLGCTFLLGNHDKRLGDLDALTSNLCSLGYFDLGARNQIISLSSGSQILLYGNELPWLERHADASPPAAPDSLAGPLPPACLRLGLSHTPDQIAWARRLKLDLLLAGHTHGGQVRIPGIGPLVSPSRYGSRFASGVFYRAPTLMHVSRGISGTHPLRWRCLPEVSMLTLRSPPA